MLQEQLPVSPDITAMASGVLGSTPRLTTTSSTGHAHVELSQNIKGMVLDHQYGVMRWT